MKKIESEKLVERRLTAFVKAKGGLCLKLISTNFRGLPDRMCLFPGGRVYFVELKTTGQKPRQSQLITHTILSKLGFEVAVIDTVAGAAEFVESKTRKNNE